MDTPFLENWATQLRKGMLELLILNAIGNSRLYGYDLVRRLRQIPGLMIGEGTVYPILSRLKREGFLRTTLEESSEGPARKYYELTGSGRRILTQMNAHWRALKSGADTIGTEKKP